MPAGRNRPFALGATAKFFVLLVKPFVVTVTSKFPLGNPVGMLRAMLVSLHDVGVAAIPPTITVLLP